MSDIIQLLPDSVANQIAAGEVIQRPASVIKELVENAVDAGATVINVVVIDAGRTSIQVIDNGKGMSETDARLSFERHATSKIRKADDLFALRSMGFRGEALASIAAVAHVELKTRMATSEIGTQINVEGSRVVSQQPVSCSVGANFSVEDLFFNVPARRKFLKSNSTELTNILAAFERIILVYPDITFTLHHGSSELVNVHSGSLKQRIVDVFGRRLSQDLLPIDVDTTLCRIHGFVGKPESARKKGAQQYFFVNGRFMKHPYFHKAVMHAFERLLPEGTQVPYFIYFDIEPADIDVNIHPTKTEIKFENEQAIWQILSASVKDAIGKFCDVPSIDFDTEGKPEIPIFDTTVDIKQPETLFNPSYNPFAPDAHRPAPADVRHAPPRTSAPNDDVQALFDSPYKSPVISSDEESITPIASQNAVLEDKSPVHYQYKGRYIMTAVKSGLMIIDQQRADIRIRYERFLERIRSASADTQRVLFPEMITLSPSRLVLLKKILPELTAMGFELTDLGGGTYVVNGIPAGIEGVEPIALLNNLVTDAEDCSSNSMDDIHKSLALSMARHVAVPRGQVLGNAEMENLVNELFSCTNANYTPDGKAVICILPQQEIERLLG